ncbi:unnamed protein product, partial [Ceratitis capitata]
MSSKIAGFLGGSCSRPQRNAMEQPTNMAREEDARSRRRRNWQTRSQTSKALASSLLVLCGPLRTSAALTMLDGD